jgi:hypothetical protein
MVLMHQKSNGQQKKEHYYHLTFIPGELGLMLWTTGGGSVTSVASYYPYSYTPHGGTLPLYTEEPKADVLPLSMVVFYLLPKMT